MERERERLQVRILPRPYTLHLGCLLVYNWQRHYSFLPFRSIVSQPQAVVGNRLISVCRISFKMFLVNLHLSDFVWGKNIHSYGL